MSSRFVRPEVVTLPISNGDSITIRKRLNAGEERAMFTRLANEDGTSVNRLQVGLSVISAFLLDWTLTDDAGKVVSISDKSVDDIERIVDGLDPDSFKEIYDAIDKHVGEQKAEREKEKNGQGGGSRSSQTSKSHESLGYPSTELVN